jgi:hypothetical protein
MPPRFRNVLTEKTTQEEPLYPVGNLKKKTVTKLAAEEVVKPAEHPITSAVHKFEALEKELRDFMSQHDKVFDEFIARADKYNEAISDVKALVAGHKESLAGVYTGAFGKNNPPVAVSYDLNKLPDDVLARPGVLVVDKKVLESLVDAQVVPASAIAAARVEKLGTPSVTKPAEIVVKFNKGR